MAFLIKKSNNSRGAVAGGQNAVVSQYIQVSRAAKALPQSGVSATEQLFRVYGGRVFIKFLVAEVTTVIEGTDPVIKVSVSSLTDAGVLQGTAYDIASTINLSSDEVGSLYMVEGDGTAINTGNQTSGSIEAFSTGFIMKQGQIYLTTGADKTGALKWDLWYQPLDAGAYVLPVNTVTAAIT